VRSKNVLNTMMMSFISLGFATTATLMDYKMAPGVDVADVHAQGSTAVHG